MEIETIMEWLDAQIEQLGDSSPKKLDELRERRSALAYEIEVFSTVIGKEPVKIRIENGDKSYPTEIDEIDRCPYCCSVDIDEDERGKIFEDSGYFGYKCYECKGTWTIAGTIDRIILDV
jgi:hypothetical protein